MITFLLSHVMTVLAVVACGLAWAKGGSAEREAAGLIGLAWAISILAQIFCTRAWLNHAMVVEPYLIAGVDALVGAGFLVLALRHSTRWLGVAVLIQASALALHAAFLTGDGLNGPTYVARINALGGVLLLVLLGATGAAWMQRRRGGRSPPPPQAAATLAR